MFRIRHLAWMLVLLVLLPVQAFAATLAIGGTGTVAHPMSASRLVHGRLVRTMPSPMHVLARHEADGRLDAGSGAAGGCDALCHLVVLATTPAPLPMLAVSHPQPQHTMLLITSRALPVADKPPRG